MNKLKESILNDVKKVGGDTTNASNETINGRNETTSSNNNTTTRSNDTYVYGVGILAVLTIGACVFFTYQLKNKNKTMIAQQLSMSKNNHQNDVICFKKNIYNK